MQASASCRRGIGRDLHDSLGQLLTGTALAGQGLKEKLASKTIGGAMDAARIVTLVEQAIELTEPFSAHALSGGNGWRHWHGVPEGSRASRRGSQDNPQL